MKWLRWTGWLEGTSFLVLLFVAMPLKYLADRPEAVRVVGMAHGVLFIAYVFCLVAAKVGGRLTNSMTFLGFLAAFLPFGPFWFDRRLSSTESDVEN